MNSPIISQETKESNFEAIAPKASEPVLIRTKQHKGGSSGWTVLFFVLFAGSSVAAYWFFSQAHTLEGKLSEVQTEIKSKNQSQDMASLSVVDRLNRHILLPQAQSAQTSTINNADELKKSDTFYEYAENGDLLVQFPNLEIIYNSIADVIVNARTKNTGQIAGAERRALQGAVSLDIRNGAGVAGLAGKTANIFTGVKEYVVSSVGNAVKSDYAKTVIVNLSGKDVSGLEQQFGVKAVTVLPIGESTSQADAVLIVGRQ